jgi:hypothetical protein
MNTPQNIERISEVKTLQEESDQSSSKCQRQLRIQAWQVFRLKFLLRG